MLGLDAIRSYMREQAEEDKNRTYVNVSGDSLEDAIEQASIELGIPVKKIEYEVLDRGKKGVLGIGKQPTLILAYPAKRDPAADADADVDVDFDFGGDEEGETDQDGEAFVRLTADGVLLKVSPPVGSGSKITEREAMEVVKARFGGKVNTGNVGKAVKAADGEWVRIADYDYNPASDPSFSVDISDNEMKAYLTILPPGQGGADPDQDTIAAFLQRNGVVDGIREKTLERLEERPAYREAVLIAEGSNPKDGADAKISYTFRTDPSKVDLKEKNGRVDFRELNIVQNVVEGQVLAKKVPAEKGQAGRTVTGKLLPAKDGRDKEIPIGKNVRLSEDESTAISEINGQVVINNEKINVEPVYVVQGDVNLRTGNILFLGAVVVKGNVDDGFTVKAAGNIEVMGSVGKSTLDAEGDIIVHQGIAGKGDGSVKSGKSVFARYIENCHVESGNLVVVSDGIINSVVLCDRKVICRGRRAAIVGGQLRAAEEIDAKTLGSVGGMETILEVGYDPKSKERLANLQEQDGQIDEQLEEISLNMTTLEKQKKAGRKIPDDKKKAYVEMKQKKVSLVSEQQKVKSEIEEIQQYLDRLRVAGRISASGTVYPGVRVFIKDAPLDVRSEFRSVSFVSEGGIVKVAKYQESDEDISVDRRE